jgi:hypothetical protein
MRRQAALTFTASARRLGLGSAIGIFVLACIYSGVLIAGLLSLATPQQPIGDPWFPMMEVLIIVIMPVMVALMVALHAWTDPENKVYSLMALVFMTLVAFLTTCLHFTILVLTRAGLTPELNWMVIYLSFKWPSLPYTLDILAWDIFFPLSVLSAARALTGSLLARIIALIMAVSGLLSLGGLSALVLQDMRLRNIGVVGYAGLFPIAALLLAILFARTPAPRSA